MLEVILLAIGLSMDAFAVSIGLGAKKPPHLRRLALQAALYFGIFQGLMPLIGYLGGRGVLGWVESYAHWIAFGLLVLIGGKMLFEAFAEGVEEEFAVVTQRVLLTLAIATSIDALAAGFSLTLLSVAPLLSCLIIALTTFGFSFAGVFVGYRTGALLESKAEILGGVVLILIGLRILLSQ